MHINVSRGAKPVPVPDVTGQPYANAKSALEGQGFIVSRTDVQSDQAAAGVVVAASPPPGTSVSKGANITLSVSKGPATTQVPDVTNYNQADATTILQQAGLTVAVITDPVTDPSQDGIVISQDPAPGADAKAGEVVSIHVGQLTGVAGRRRHHDADHHHDAAPVTRRIAVILGGRSSENAISLASAASVIDALAASGNEVVPVQIDRSGAWQLGTSREPRELGSAERTECGAPAAPAAARGRDDPRGRRRRLPGAARAVRGGRDGAGTARARGCALRRRRRARVGALHGQGRLQVGDARPRHPGDREHHAPPRRRAAQPVRLPVLRQACAARLERRHHEGARRCRATRGCAARVRARREGARRAVRRGNRGRGRRAREPDPDRIAARRDRRHAQRVVRLRSEVRRGRDGPRRAGTPDSRADRARAGARGARVQSRPTARGWRAPTSSSARTARCS